MTAEALRVTDGPVVWDAARDAERSWQAVRLAELLSADVPPAERA